MAEKGINLILLARREDNLIKIKEDIQEKFSIKIMVIAADLSQIPEYERIYDECKRNHFMTDFLVNNAGYTRIERFIESTPKEWDKQIDICLKGSINCCHLVIEKMIKN